MSDDNLFDLSELEAAVTGTPGQVSIHYGLDYNISLDSGQLAPLTTEISTGTALGTVGDALAKSGAIAKFNEINEAMAAKGHAKNIDGYSITVLDVNGTPRNTTGVDLNQALSLPVYDGDVISVVGKIKGATQ